MNRSSVQQTCSSDSSGSGLRITPSKVPWIVEKIRLRVTMIPFNARSDAVEFSQCERNSTNQAIEARRDSEPDGSEAEGRRGCEAELI
jgi:hypothetical protein